MEAGTKTHHVQELDQRSRGPAWPSSDLRARVPNICCTACASLTSSILLPLLRAPLGACGRCLLSGPFASALLTLPTTI
jgi:hypothetical protein